MLRRKCPLHLVVFITLIFLTILWKIIFVGIDFPTRTNYQDEYNLFPTYVLNTINSTYVYPRNQLPISDYNTLMNLTDFRFDHLNKFTSFPTLLLVLVHSTPDNFHKRKCIRETWGEKRTNLKVVFLLGRAIDWRLRKRLDEEREQFGDLAQGNFVDSYKNMTYKHVMALKYAIDHCPQAKYILKVDDDVFVNMELMIDILTTQLSPYGVKNLLFCEVMQHFAVRRIIKSKWSVTYDEYEDKYYPPYCSGLAVLYSPDVLFILYRAAQKAKYFWVDDVFITGILAKKENIRHTDARSLALPKEYLKKIIKHSGYYIIPFLYGPINVNVKQIRLLWEYVKNQTKNKSVLKYEEKRNLLLW